MMEQHKVKYNTYSKIHTFECDKKISDLIMWLNSLRGIETFFSCQNQSDESYIFFKCEYLPSLYVISITLNSYRASKDREINLSIQYSNPENVVSFNMHFPKDWLEDFTEFISTVKIFGAERNGMDLLEKNKGNNHETI